MRSARRGALIVNYPEEETVTRIGNFAVERGPELVGDIFGPRAKWFLILLKYVLENDDLARIIGNLFPTESHTGPRHRRSVVQIVASKVAHIQSAFEADVLAALRSSALLICALTLSFIVSHWVGGSWVFCFHALWWRGVSEEGVTFYTAAFWEGAFACLRGIYYLGPVDSNRIMVYMLASVVVFVVQFMITIGSDARKEFELVAVGALWVCSWSLSFYMPLWFGLCLSVLVAVSEELGVCELLAVWKELRPQLMLWSAPSFSAVCVVLHLSSGGFSGLVICSVASLLVFLHIVREENEDVAEMLAPFPPSVPLVSALAFSCFVPFWGGVCLSIIVYIFAIASSELKHLLWWGASFVALRAIFYSSGGFSGLAMCLLGSVFSYGFLF